MKPNKTLEERVKELENEIRLGKVNPVIAMMFITLITWLFNIIYTL